jgi:hypothetical protein
MGAPLLIPAIGAAAGALMKPNNPLQGALLGAVAGYTGGAALGVGGAAGAAGTAAGTAGTAAGTAAATPYAIPGLVSSAAPALAGQTAAAATPYAIPGLVSSAAPALSGQVATAPYSIPGLSGGASPAFAGANSLSNAVSSGASGFPINQSIGQAASPSFLDKIGMAGKSAYENPMMTAQALNATNSLLTPEQMPSAPTVPVQARGQLKPFNPMESMDPYRQSVISNQPISLLG